MLSKMTEVADVLGGEQSGVVYGESEDVGGFVSHQSPSVVRNRFNNRTSCVMCS